MSISRVNAASICDDVLLQIFLQCFQSYDDLSHSYLRRVHRIGRTPWNLAAVYKNWRRTCLANPTLWTQFTTNDHLQCI
ncbi:hypothetical protein BDV98DRAFT_558829 [Pterulicium gracile]|uniref:F-box domain-containing protein n=1 Tax=Pterulicium gracile TaxID=1884261 RepID=A0A5C3QVS6_9AGAR|nr:hypothetical protein BDV98DRAFT_558829 [Pterula gracilis]